MFDGESAPPRFNGVTWSITYPGHAPVDFPVERQGRDVLNSLFACWLRAIRPSLSRGTAAAWLLWCLPVGLFRALPV
jgi:hypothetical protein